MNMKLLVCQVALIIKKLSVISIFITTLICYCLKYKKTGAWILRLRYNLGYENGAGEWDEYRQYLNPEGLELGSPVSIVWSFFSKFNHLI